MKHHLQEDVRKGKGHASPSGKHAAEIRACLALSLLQKHWCSSGEHLRAATVASQVTQQYARAQWNDSQRVQCHILPQARFAACQQRIQHVGAERIRICTLGTQYVQACPKHSETPYA